MVVAAATKREPGGPARLAIDTYDGVAVRRLAAVDLETLYPEEYALLHTQLINSRWVAITLDGELERMLLFDFKSASTH